MDRDEAASVEISDSIVCRCVARNASNASLPRVCSAATPYKSIVTSASHAAICSS
jgi:ribosomal protein L40E